MGAAYVLVILVVVVLVGGGLALRQLGDRRQQDHERIVEAEHTLRYHVPEGQDPAAVLVALSRAGFEASADPGDVHLVTIRCPIGPEQREEVRLVLERETANTLEGQERGSVGDPPPPQAARVRFADER
jgi:hypothetical protein